ncbi:MAG: Redoxin [Gaiellaceae bacterium]|jgi:peroxiredoxin|nr:Redoxin [Gaiellaceae bacterium]
MRIRTSTAAWIAAGAVAAAGAMVLAYHQATSVEPTLPRGGTAPAVDLPAVAGGRVIAAQRPVVVAFVSTACGSCERTAGQLVRLAGRGVAVAAIAQPDATDDVLASFASGPLAGAVPLARDDRATGSAFRVSAFPTVYVIDASGRIADAWVGDEPPERFDEALTPPRA